ncbi:MAG: tetratricopeptide repeat protein [Mojavia pulchra JT2-VF2]|jgi:tetratricopeptide (TPR) repeat protein|uniref:Tetratricopeptide repeat protein n=1 Tax=Mojavia pulchra JT2-VF2 TaxID=287848 RepID=A0A951Q0J6_9NOST|nr:tetratricopeptide repeat protein [Mojavia pulchra JT2-VF2]
MEWTNLLKAQQFDFIQRLQSKYLLNCEIKGQHSELTVIGGDSLSHLRDFCWEMVKKYRPNDPKNYFINNMKGKLGEEVIKTRLAEFVTEVDYETKVNGDGKVDFTLTSDSSIGIQVKARYGRFDTVKWSITQEEISKNAILVCILIQEEISEAQPIYNLILAGFIPTNMIVLTDAKASLNIENLLYAGGLYSYLENLISCKKNSKLEQGVECHPNKEVATQDANSFVNNYTNNQFAKLAIEYFNLANSYHKQKQYQTATTYYNQALELNPYFVDGYFWRGLSFYENQDYQLAIQDFDTVILMKPDEYKAYNNRGLTLYALNDKQKAIEDFKYSISILKKSSALTYYYSGITRDALGEIQEAIKDYTESIKLNPHFYIFYLERGTSRSNLGDTQGGIDDYSEAIRIHPNCDNAYYLRGIKHFKIGDKNKAIYDYTQAININNKNYEYYLNRAYARYAIGDKEGSIADYTDAISLNPHLAVAFAKRGTARYKLRDIKGAIKDYTSAINIDYKDSITYFNRSFAYYKIGDMQRAVNDYNQALKLNPKLAASKQARKLKKLLYSSNNLEKINNHQLESMINHSDEEDEDDYDNLSINTNSYTEYYDRDLDYGYLEDLDNDDYYYYFKGCREL